MQLASVAGGPKVPRPLTPMSLTVTRETSNAPGQTPGIQHPEDCGCCPTETPAEASKPQNTPLSLLQKTLLFPIKIYQKLTEPVYHWLSEMTGIPSFCLHCQAGKLSCSEYTQGAIREFGMFRGLWDGFKRILSCNPVNAYLHYVKHKPLRDPEMLSPEIAAAVRRPRQKLNVAA